MPSHEYALRNGKTVLLIPLIRLFLSYFKKKQEQLAGEKTGRVEMAGVFVHNKRTKRS